MFGRRRRAAPLPPHCEHDKPISIPRVKGSLVSLEPRLMFDGAALVTAVEVVAHEATQTEAGGAGDGGTEVSSAKESDSHDLLQAVAAYAPGESRTEIVFVDPTVPDYATLLAGVGANAEVVLLDGSRDGMDQIAQALSGRSGIDAIHLITHGSEGRLVLGTGALTQESMVRDYTEELATIQRSLSETADILVYGCNFSEGTQGQAAAALLSELTGADVAASLDATGAASLGGDWILETQTGSIETALVVSEEGQANWQALLAANTAPSFAVGDGIVTTAIGSVDDGSESVVIQPDGKILVAGYSDSGSGNDFAIARYNANGSLDTSFGGGDGIVTIPGTTTGRKVELQADGKILVAGTYLNNSNNNDFALVRLNTDGSLDTTFGGGDGIAITAIGTGSDFGHAITVQADGKILVGGYSDNGTDYDFAIVRYNTDGTLDTSFSGDGKLTTPIGQGNDRAMGISVQADGKIVVSGYSSNGTNNDFSLARYNTDGTLDTSFSGDGMLTTAIGTGTDEARSVTIQPDGKILVGGYSSNNFALARYNTDGTLDTSFSGDGKLTTSINTGIDYSRGIALQSDGKILLAGYTYNGTDYDFAVVRYNADGSLDTSFSGDGMVSTAIGSGDDYGYSIAVQTDGKIVVSGYSFNGTKNDFAVLRYNADGTLDHNYNAANTLDGTPTFTEGGSPVVLDSNVQVYDSELSVADNFNGATLTLARNGGANSEDVFSATGTLSLSSGNVVVSGTTIGTYTNSGGTLALTFNSSATNALVNSAMQQIAYSNTSDAPPASVQIDWTFNDGNTGSQGTGGALTGTGHVTVAITAVNDAPVITNLSGDTLAYTEGDGAVVIEQGGNVVVTDADSANFDTGTLTVSLISGSDTAEDVLSIRNEGTGAGQISVAGYGIGYEGTLIGSYTGGANGTPLVITFNSSATPTAVTALIKHITYENTDTASPTTGARTVRYVLTDGDGGTSANYDTTVTVTATNDAPAFGSGDGVVTTALGANGGGGYSIAVQADGKMVVAGERSNGVDNDFALVRYNSDGSLDTSFGTGGTVITSLGGDESARSVTVQADGKILVAGGSYNGSADLFAVVRYNSNGSLDTSFGTGGVVTTAIGTEGDVGRSVTLQADGKILVAGFSYSGGYADFALVRYNSDGSLDTSFSSDGKLTAVLGAGDDYGLSVTLQADGKIVVSGESYNGSNSDFALVRYNSDGSLDTSFGTGGVVSTAVGASFDVGQSVTVQADGKILVGGVSYTGGTAEVALVRYNTDGTLDTSFSSDGKLTMTMGTGDAAGYSVTMQADGKILVSGESYNGSNKDFALVRYNSNGSLDTTFGTGGTVTTAIGIGDDIGRSVTVQPDGKIVVAGGSATGSGDAFAVVRYNSDGTLDTTFDSANTLDGTPTFTEGGSPVVLDATVLAYDPELSALDNFTGATLTLARNGGANSEDVFSATGTLSLSSGNVVVSGTTIGTYTNSGGTLALTFNSSATNALVNSAMQQIAYSNTSDAPPASVQIDWTFNDGNTGSQGTGGALTGTGHVTVAITAVNDAPTAVSLSASTVAENAANGTVVGTASTTDPDAGDTHTYSLTDTAGGRFAINSSTGVLTVADGSLLNYEAATSHSVTVRVTDSGGLTYDQTVTISVTNVNEAPTGLSLSASTVAENAANGTVVGTATGTDPDAGDTKSYSLTDSAGGRFAIDGSTGVLSVADGSLLNYEAATSHSVTVRVTDSGGLTYDQTFTITVSNVNEAPVNTVPGPQTVTQDTPVTISGINVADVDGNLSTVQVGVVNGTVSVALSGSATISAGASGTRSLTLTGSQADINATLATLTYRGNSSFAGTDTVTIRSLDTGGLSQVSSVAITVQANVPANVPASLLPGTGPLPPAPGPGPQSAPAGTSTGPTPSSPQPGEPHPVAPSGTPVQSGPPPTFTSFAGGSTMPAGVAGHQSEAPGAGSIQPAAVHDQPNARIGGPEGGEIGVWEAAEPVFDSLLHASDRLKEVIRDAGWPRPVQEALASELDALDAALEQAIESSHGGLSFHLAAETAAGVVLSVGSLVTMLRGGWLVTSMLMTMPTWRVVDPLPVVLHRQRPDEGAMAGTGGGGKDDEIVNRFFPDASGGKP